MIHFTISELIRSRTAIENRIWNGANREQENNLIALVDNVLDPLRIRYGMPVHVSSGFRCSQLNGRTSGSSKNSQHMNGEAADLYTDAGVQGNYDIGCLIVSLGHFDQIIFENVSHDNLLPQWIHVSWKRRGSNRHEIRKHVIGSGDAYPLITIKELGL